MTAPTPAEQLWFVAEALQQQIAAQAATIEQLEEDAHIAETKFQQQSMILEQQTAEIKRLRDQLAAAQQQYEPVPDGKYTRPNWDGNGEVTWLITHNATEIECWHSSNEKDVEGIWLADDWCICRRVPAQAEQEAMPVPDWASAPEWANWWAANAGKTMGWYELKPIIITGDPYWSEQHGRKLHANMLTDLPVGVDWRTTLVARPAAQPKQEDDDA